MNFRKMTHHEEMRLNTLLLAVFCTLAIQFGLIGWTRGQPWLYANAALFVAVGLGFLWRLQHPRTPEPLAAETMADEVAARAKVDRFSYAGVFVAFWLSALSVGLAAWTRDVPWLYLVAAALAAASAAPLSKLRR